MNLLLNEIRRNPLLWLLAFVPDSDNRFTVFSLGAEF